MKKKINLSPVNYFSLLKTTCFLDFIHSKFSAGRNAYIGLVREVANSSWIWEDGTLLTYQNWNPTEPNNIGGFENNVELVGTEEHGGWNDIPNHIINTVVCQVQCPIELKTEAQAEKPQEDSSEEPQQEDSKIFFTNIFEILLSSIFYVF